MVYQNVFSFTNRVQVKATMMEPATVHQNLDACLLGQADKWYTEELSHIQQVSLRLDTNGVEEWCKALEQRFQDPPSKSLTMLETTRYTVDDARKNHEPASYVQSIVVNGRNAGITTTDYAQVLLAYKHLDSELRLTLTEPTLQTTVAQFIEQLNSRKHAWFEIYRRNRGYTAMHERECRDQAGGNRYQGKQGFNQYSNQSNQFNSN